MSNLSFVAEHNGAAHVIISHPIIDESVSRVACEVSRLENSSSFPIDCEHPHYLLLRPQAHSPGLYAEVKSVVQGYATSRTVKPILAERDIGL